MKASILVTDGDERSALAIVRSLGRAGYAVFVCSQRGRSLAGASRYARIEARVPDPMREPEPYLDAIERLVRTWQIDVLIPVTDASLLAILPVRERFRDVYIPFPTAEAFRRVFDKATVLQAAREVGIATPDQWIVPHPAAAHLPDIDVSRPLVVKPARSLAETNGRRERVRVRYARHGRALREILDSFPGGAYPLLVQERVVGPGVGIFLLTWDRRVLASFAHRRIREKPPSGGVSTYRESIHADPELVARSHTLLEQFAWQGVAMLEYKIEERTGIPHLMEVNGRFWGSLQLAIDAGVDFPTLLIDAALEPAAPPVTSYRVGIRSRWWWGDLDHLLARVRRSPADLDLSPDLGGAWSALRDFLVLWRPGDRNEVLRLSDPLPFVHETRVWVQTALHGARASRAHARRTRLTTAQAEDRV